MTEQIVVGYDGSPSARRAVQFAQDAALAREVGLIVAHVLEWSPYTFLSPQELEERHMRREEELKRADHAILRPLIMELESRGGGDITTVSRFGNIAEMLARIASETKASQIVIGRTGHSSLASRLFGSVAGALAQAAPVPVTIVP
ncbi:Universal stress protein/MT2052 [Jannaschia seosinensis]|uniref:Universal stress protein/MT2052 n=1 Tax=Jannaschia seosinensis TaxID=313367 RepID=A0A0M7BBI4_9RHOB|nr:universal stress protein [Jannaschia seosinensis]CUH39559.1 Universal stress protein/MT2052 [Jannaschia seosinensis]